MFYSDGKIKEYPSRRAVLEANQDQTEMNTDQNPTELLYKKSKNKSLSDLIYSEPTDDDLDDSYINRLDTTNHRFHSAPAQIPQKSLQSYGPKFNEIKAQVDDEYIQKIEFLRKLYNILVKSRFITGGPKIEGLDEMLPSDSDEEEFKETHIHRYIHSSEYLFLSVILSIILCIFNTMAVERRN